MAGEWLDDLGIAELRAGVVKQAYRDYVTALITVKAFAYNKTLNPGKNLTSEYRRIESAARTMSRYWSKRYPARSASQIKKRLRWIYNEAQGKAAAVERFFRSRRFELFSDNIHGETLIAYAKEQVERWAKDEITKFQCLPNNMDEGANAAQKKKEKWRET